MSLSVYFADPKATFIADASVIINLNASGRAQQIVESVRGRIFVPGNASVELAIGATFGHDDGRQLDAIVIAGVVRRIELGKEALLIYESLIDGSRGQTLDDGEAATIATAFECGAIALLDEKKARRICREHFPTLTVGCTAQLLLSATFLGAGIQTDAIVNALLRGRMRVPAEYINDIVALIGLETAARCPSLSRLVRATNVYRK